MSLIRKVLIMLLPLTILAGCTTTALPTLPGLAQLKPIASAAVQIALVQGKITPAQATQVNAALDAINGGNLDLAGLGKLALAAAVSSGKISPAQAVEIQTILDALNAAQAQAPAATVPTPTPVPTATP